MPDVLTQHLDFASLYRHAFAEYGTQALWNKRMLEEPTPEDALVVARALRIEGDREARELAEQIEQACRAALRIQSEILERAGNFAAGHGASRCLYRTYCVGGWRPDRPEGLISEIRTI